MLAHDRVGIVAAAAQGRRRAARSRGIAERDRDVPEPPAKAEPAQRAALGLLEVLRLAPAEELDEVRRVEAVPHAKVRLRCDLRKLVPGADELAVVAAENAVADRGPERLGDRPVMLDREV